MNKQILLKSQKNEVFQLIKNAGLDPFNFAWQEETSKFDSSLVDCLKYQQTGFFFKFDYRERQKHFSTISPGKETLVQDLYPGSWPYQLNNVAEWLSYLKREIEEPDLWQEMSKYQISSAIPIGADTENTPFTVYQFEKIEKAIQQIRSYVIETSQLEQSHRDLVDEKLDYLIGAAKRQGRTDWVHTCIGIIVTIAVAVSLSPEQVNDIWSILKEAVSGIIKLLPG